MRPSCLVVQSDANLIRVLARQMEKHRIVGVADVTQVAATVEELHPRAIITTSDHQKETEAALAEVPYGVPVISFGLARHSTSEALDSASAYVVKPVSPEVLWSTVRRVGIPTEAHVLIVDDDPDAVRLMDDMLSLMPSAHTAHRSYSGQQALDYMATVVPDIVFIDLMMPDLDGESTVARMRQDDRLRQVPVVIVSGVDQDDPGLLVTAPIQVSFSQPIRLSRITALEALLDSFPPHYLPETDTAPRSG